MIVPLVILALCLLFEGFFSGSELALVSADKVKLRHLAEGGGKKQRAILSFLEDPGELISTSLVGTNICVVLSTVVATLTLMQWSHQAELLSLAVMTPLVLIFGEIVPKSIFQYYADSLAPKAIYALWFVRLLFYPLVVTGSYLSRLLLRLLGMELDEKGLMSREELRLLLKLPSREGTNRITADERRMVTRIFSFKDMTVVDVMLPLSEVTAMPMTATLEEVAQEIADKQHTRLPLYKERIDQIIGIVHAFDVLGAKGDEKVCDLCRSAIFVPESQRVVDTLVRLKREGQGIAVVVDEYGGATGIVSIEDILEEIVGEIDDEYDDVELDLIIREPAGTFRVLGKAPVARVNEALRLNLPMGDEYESIAGLILDRIKRIPSAGERIGVEGVILQVLRATERSIEEVRLSPGRKKGAR